MPVVLSGLAAVRPVAITSPLTELGCALHVLGDPAHHDAGEWASTVRAAMSARLAEQTERWAWTTQAIRALPFVTPEASSGDLAGEIERLQAGAAADVARGLLRPISPDGDVSAAVRWARSRGPSTTALVESLVNEPATAVAAFAAFLECCRREWFGAEWARLRARLARRAREVGDLVDRAGATDALARLDPSVVPSGRDAVRITKVQNRRHDLTRRGLVCVPSAFIRPHVYVGDVPGRPLLLIHPLDRPPDPVPDVATLMRRLEAVSNLGRLEVARAIATEPRTAGEVAGLWHLEPTLVNRQLRTLAAAGLARTTRRGRFVQYSLNAAAVADLGDELLALLLR